ncbi:MAG: hypothetical protein M0041_01490 [Nitrospiraceae bacterium]|jgi:hypothetical protein|nr:hypothetical protein [Nitrospiraceae bacterium]
MRLFQIQRELLGIVFGSLLVVAGCHSPQETSKTATSSGPVTPSAAKHAASPPLLPGELGGANSFVPYADKPPLGTPVETH